MEFLILIIIIGLIIAIIVGLLSSDKDDSDAEQRRAGKRGEKKAASVIEKVLRDGDNLFSNVEVVFNNSRAEMDCVVVNKYGVFIIEVKNYVGHIEGREEDRNWRKYKITNAQNIYGKTVRNPIPQVKRQVHIFAGYLKSHGINVWVKGYAMLVNKNSPVKSEYILSNIDEIDRAIHTTDRTLLSDSAVENIRILLGSIQGETK